MTRRQEKLISASTAVAETRLHPTVTENTTDRVGVTLGVVLVVTECDAVAEVDMVNVADIVADAVAVGELEGLAVSVTEAVEVCEGVTEGEGEMVTVKVTVADELGVVDSVGVFDADGTATQTGTDHSRSKTQVSSNGRQVITQSRLYAAICQQKAKVVKKIHSTMDSARSRTIIVCRYHARLLHGEGRFLQSEHVAVGSTIKERACCHSWAAPTEWQAGVIGPQDAGGCPRGDAVK